MYRQPISPRRLPNPWGTVHSFLQPILFPDHPIGRLGQVRRNINQGARHGFRSLRHLGLELRAFVAPFLA